ncbi:MAG: hypothetical protein ACJAQ3_000146 [Planctomycetota bacterium]|jgi:hypothetical protein
MTEDPRPATQVAGRGSFHDAPMLRLERVMADLNLGPFGGFFRRVGGNALPKWLVLREACGLTERSRVSFPALRRRIERRRYSWFREP